MAKKLSREQRRKQKEKEQRILKSKGYSTKQIQKLSNKELKDISGNIITEQQAKEKKRQKHKAQYQKQLKDTGWKFQELVAKGFSPDVLTTTNLRKVKKKDIKEGNINKKNYPFLYPELKVTKQQLQFDFNKKFKFPEGKGMYIAYCDFTGEKNFGALLNSYNRKSNKELLLKLNGLIQQPETYNKNLHRKTKGKEGGSSGYAGDYQMLIGDISKIKRFDDKVMGDEYASIFFPQRKRQHTGQYNKWQKLIDKDGNIYISEFTTHKILALTVAIMDNITEDLRGPFYKRMYSDITYYFPELKEVFPNP